MLILTAECDSQGHKESWELVPELPMYLGRSSDNDCSIHWDHQVSRNHAELKVHGDSLQVRCLPRSRNLLETAGTRQVYAEIPVGDSFRIGQTTFNVTSRIRSQPAVKVIDQGVGTDTNTTSMIMNPADIRLAVVSQNAPSLWLAEGNRALAKRALEILNQVLTGADLLVVVSCKDVKSADRPKVIHWHKDESGLQAVVSRQLISQALEKSETAIQVESDIHGDPIAEGRWSFCVPVSSENSEPWCVYVAGVFGKAADYGPFLTPERLKADANVTELVAHLTGAIRSVRSLENRFDGLRQFFSPRLLDAIPRDAGGLPDMAPQETDIVALYCDLRGFSRLAARSTGDLHRLLARVSGALSVMTSSIIQHHGAIADFQGDSALGFWGWPVALSDGALPAIRAALQIRRIFAQASIHTGGDLEGFDVGIGLAKGRAIAGRIGTGDHGKIGVFGPVVNVASRLEGLTKSVGASILMDQATAEFARAQLPSREGRCRRIGHIQPAGFDAPLQVTQLLPPEETSEIADDDIANFANALDAFETGTWEHCRNLLGNLPATDRCRDFLLVQMASENYRPPSSWDGVIRMSAK